MSAWAEGQDEIIPENWPIYHTEVPVWVLLSGTRSHSYKAYAFLAEHINNRRPGERIACPKQAAIARVLGLKNPRQVASYMNELAKIGAVRIEEYRYQGGMRRGYRYYVRFNPPAGYTGLLTLGQFYDDNSDVRSAESAGRTASSGARGGPKSPPCGVPKSRTSGGTKNSTSGGTKNSTARAVKNRSPELDQENADQQNGPPVRPSVPDPGARARTDSTEGRTDGEGGDVVQEQGPAVAGGGAATADAGPDKTRATKPVAVTAGVALLLSIGAEVPALLLSGQTLADQGAMVTGMLESGWSPGQLRQVIAGRPLPHPIRTTVGGVISARLRAAVAAPAPGSVPRLPAQSSGPEAVGGLAEVTPVPPSWAAQQAALEAATAGRGPLRDCDGDGGLCPRLAVPGESMCAEHLGWELCPQCTARRVRPGRELCGRCEDDNGRPMPSDSEFAALLAEAARRAKEADTATF
jgi:hypothetical protein